MVAPLKKNAVQIQMPNFLDGYIVDIFAPRQMSPPPDIPLRPICFERHIELMRCLSQVIQIAAMDMPGQNAEFAHSASVSFITASTVIPWAQGWPIGQDR